MWHASISPLHGVMPERELRRLAKKVVAGVGDARAGEWWERGGRVVHVRRRLSETEQGKVGPVIDVRGTPEAFERALRLGGRLRHVPPEILAEEIGQADR